MNNFSYIQAQLAQKQHEILVINNEINQIERDIDRAQEEAKWTCGDYILVFIGFFVMIALIGIVIVGVVTSRKSKQKEKVKKLEKEKKHLEQKLHQLNNEYGLLLSHSNLYNE